MKEPATDEVMDLLARMSRGEPGALDRLMPMVYDELRAIAAGLLRRERADHTLQPTALVNEAYLKLVGHTELDWKERAHFLAVAATAIRRVLVEHARKTSAAKRGGDWERLTLSDIGDLDRDAIDLIDLDEALTRLAELDERRAQVVKLRCFAGLTGEETACVLGVSRWTVTNDWTIARAWLLSELAGETGGPGGSDR